MNYGVDAWKVLLWKCNEQECIKTDDEADLWTVGRGPGGMFGRCKVIELAYYLFKVNFLIFINLITVL